MMPDSDGRDRQPASSRPDNVAQPSTATENPDSTSQSGPLLTVCFVQDRGEQERYRDLETFVLIDRASPTVTVMFSASR
jgi:hypothetical protein